MNKRQTKDLLYEQVARIGKAVSSPKRLELLEILAQGEKTVDALAAEAGIDIKLASAHLKVLKAARLVEAQRDGRFIAYRLSGRGRQRAVGQPAHGGGRTPGRTQGGDGPDFCRAGKARRRNAAFADGQGATRRRGGDRRAAVRRIRQRPSAVCALDAARRNPSAHQGTARRPRHRRLLPRAVLHDVRRGGGAAERTRLSRAKNRRRHAEWQAAGLPLAES